MTSDDVKNVIIWGNHSSTQYPDVNHAKVKLQGKEVGVYEALKDDSWLKGEFIYHTGLGLMDMRVYVSGGIWLPIQCLYKSI